MRNITQRKLDNERLNAALRASERIGHERNAALHESERIANEREKLNRLGDLFQSCQSVEEACKVVASLAASIFESRPGILFLTNSSRNLVESAAKWGDDSNTKEVFEPSDCWGLRLGKAYAGGDATASLRCSHLHETAAAYQCVPLVAQGETYGVLYVEDKRIASESTEGKAKTGMDHLATAVAERISLAIANLKLREVLRNQSIRDPLTGLFNRRYLQESLTRELHRAGRTRRSVSLVMLDLDHFKRFNDTFGHQAGDALLREFGAVLNVRVRAGDLACRYGGEEFALLLSEADAMGAQACVNHIRDAVKKLSVQFRGQSLGSVTLSAGIAVFPDHGDNSEDLIQNADAALYQAKKEGRDRVAISEQLLHK